MAAEDFEIAGLGPVNRPDQYLPQAKRIILDTHAAALHTLFNVAYSSPFPAKPGVLADVEIWANASLPRQSYIEPVTEKEVEDYFARNEKTFCTEFAVRCDQYANLAETEWESMGTFGSVKRRPHVGSLLAVAAWEPVTYTQQTAEEAAIL